MIFGNITIPSMKLMFTFKHSDEVTGEGGLAVFNHETGASHFNVTEQFPAKVLADILLGRKLSRNSNVSTLSFDGFVWDLRAEVTDAIGHVTLEDHIINFCFDQVDGHITVYNIAYCSNDLHIMSSADIMCALALAFDNSINDQEILDRAENCQFHQPELRFIP